jgi:hypothetical protein
MCCNPAFSAQPLTMYQTTFCKMPSPQILSVRATVRKIFPSLIPAATVHSSSADLAHNGMGTVRMCPLLPIRSHGPMPLTHLNVAHLQPDQFRSSESAAKQHSQHGVVALGAQGSCRRRVLGPPSTRPR